MNPYKGLLVNRIFFQPGYNVDITVNVEFDGKPYEIHRVVRCRKTVAGRAVFETFYAYFPDFGVFGVETKTGEGIIVATPAVCAERVWDTKVKASWWRKWEIPLPKGHVPFISVLDSVKDPKNLSMYISKTAYESPAARLKFLNMEIKEPSFFRKIRWASSFPDEFFLFSPGFGMYPEDRRPKQVLWAGMAVVELPESFWSRSLSDIARRSMKLGVDDLKDATEMISLKNMLALREAFGSLRSGYGLADGTLIQNFRTRESLSKQSGFEYVVPYQLKGDIWEPDYTHKGMMVYSHPSIFRSATNLSLVDNNGQFEVYNTEEWVKKIPRLLKIENTILLGGETLIQNVSVSNKINLMFGKKTREAKEFKPLLMGAFSLYDPKTKKIYERVGAGGFLQWEYKN